MSRRNHSRQIAATRAFSLVELLIVIAVIVILIALLLPMLAVSRASARSQQCAQQLEQLGISMTRAGVARVAKMPASWTSTLAPHLDDAGKMLRCPDDISTGTGSGLSYAINARAARFGTGDSLKILALEYKLPVANVVGPQGTDDWSSSVAARHRGSVHVLSVDGSVERRRPDTIDPRICDIHDRLWRPTQDYNLLRPGCTKDVSLTPSPTSTTTTTGAAATSSTAAGGTTTSSSTTTTGGSTTTTTTTTSTTTGGSTTGTTPFCDRPALAGILARYEFDDPNDPGLDSSGNGFHATQLVGVDWETDAAHCGVVHFSKNGSADTQDKIYLPDAIVNGKTDLTLANWFKTSSTQEQVFVSTAIAGCSANELVYELEVNTAFWYHDHCPPAVWTSGVISAARDGVWHHAAVVRNTAANNVILYIDGVSIGTLSVGTHVQPFNGVAGTTMMGQEQDCPNGCMAAHQRMIGRIDDLHVYPRVLTPAEIQTLAAPP